MLVTLLSTDDLRTLIAQATDELRERAEHDWQDEVRQVALQHGVTVADIMGKRRSRHLVVARHDIWKRLLRRFSSVRIGLWWGVHHSTILYAKGAMPKARAVQWRRAA